MDRSLVQLTLVRFREFIRQPEAVFWTFVFPILLAVGLGLAFRSKAPDKPKVGIVASTPATSAIAATLEKDSTLTVEQMDDSAAARALRTAKVALIVLSDSDGTVRYVYDPQRDESVFARLITDRAIQGAAGRVDPVKVVEVVARHVIQGTVVGRFIERPEVNVPQPQSTPPGESDV